MASYSTQEEIKVSDYRRAQHPATLIAEVEGRVRRTLEGAPHEAGELPTGDIRVGWLVVVPGVGTWPWVPGEELREGAETLWCRGRRYA